MDLAEAKKLTLDLMSEHGLTYDGWSFKWHNRKRSFGTCYYRRKQIALSKVLTPHLALHQVKNTILHEIAHALVGSGHGHGSVWQRQAIAIGCDGSRCSDHDISMIQAKYEAECDCGVTHKAHRKPRRTHWCNCKRGFDPNESLTYVQNF